MTQGERNHFSFTTLLFREKYVHNNVIIMIPHKIQRGYLSHESREMSCQRAESRHLSVQKTNHGREYLLIILTTRAGAGTRGGCEQGLVRVQRLVQGDGL